MSGVQKRKPLRYRAVRGMNYGPEFTRRLEPGDQLPADFPEKSLGWLLEQGAIERIDEPEQEG